MKKIVKVIFIPLLPFIVIILLLFYFENKINFIGNNEKEEIKVATTIFPLFDITRNIAGDKMQVVNILPPGASPHTFSLRPQDIKKLNKTKVIFVVGEMDNWVQEVASSLEGIEIYPVNKNINLKSSHLHHHLEEDHHHNNFDPHYWLSLNNAKIIAENITEKLSLIDPQNREYYQKNLKSYLGEIENTRVQIINLLSSLSNRNMIVFHDSWNYFADEFNLKIVGVFTPTPGKEPSPEYLKNLYDTAQQYNIKAVFSEPQLSSEVINSFVEDLGLKVYVIDPLGGENSQSTYLKTMLSNAQIIYKALK